MMKSIVSAALKVGFVLSSITTPVAMSKRILGLCERNCKSDIDCIEGLWCTREHKDELTRAGYNRNYADCENTSVSFVEVCFNSLILSAKTDHRHLKQPESLQQTEFGRMLESSNNMLAPRTTSGIDRRQLLDDHVRMTEALDIRGVMRNEESNKILKDTNELGCDEKLRCIGCTGCNGMQRKTPNAGDGTTPKRTMITKATMKKGMRNTNENTKGNKKMRVMQVGQMKKSMFKMKSPSKMNPPLAMNMSPKSNKKKVFGVCKQDVGCKSAMDCGKGLLCSRQHENELQSLGFNPKTVDCEGEKHSHNVCFNPKCLKRYAGAGGDPHFRTYDGSKFSYHGQCDLILARTADLDGSGTRLDLHIRTELKTEWSFIANAAVRIGNDTFEVIANIGKAFLNGQHIRKFPLDMGTKYVVNNYDDKLERKDISSGQTRSIDRSVYAIPIGNGESIVITVFKGMISVRVNAFFADSEGLLGIHDQVGMVGRNLLPIVNNDTNAFGREWQVNGSEPMIFTKTRTPQFPEQCVLPSVALKGRRRLKTVQGDTIQLAAQACANIKDKDMYQFCIDDVSVTGDTDLAEGYVDETF